MLTLYNNDKAKQIQASRKKKMRRGIK